MPYIIYSSLVSDVQKEVDNLNARVFYLLYSHDDIKSDVKVMKRAAQKTRGDIQRQEEDKQRQVAVIALNVMFVNIIAEK